MQAVFTVKHRSDIKFDDVERTAWIGLAQLVTIGGDAVRTRLGRVMTIYEMHG